MMRQATSVILNTRSIFGHVVMVMVGRGACWLPSQSAVHPVTRQISVQYASCEIRVNCVEVGIVDMPVLQHSAQATADPVGFFEGLERNHSVGRIATG